MAQTEEAKRGAKVRDPNIMRQNVEQLYRLWEASPNHKKAELLLQGPALAWAESWVLTAAGSSNAGLKHYIQRSLSRGTAQSAAGRAVAQTEELSKESRIYWLVIAMAAFTVTTLLPPMIKDTIELVAGPSTKPVVAIAKRSNIAPPLQQGDHLQQNEPGQAAGTDKLEGSDRPEGSDQPEDSDKDQSATSVTIGPNGTVTTTAIIPGSNQSTAPGMTFNRKSFIATPAPVKPPMTSTNVVQPRRQARPQKSDYELAIDRLRHLTQLSQTARDRGERALAAQIAAEAYQAQRDSVPADRPSEYERHALSVMLRALKEVRSLLNAGEFLATGGQLTFCEPAGTALGALADGRVVIWDTEQKAEFAAFAASQELGRFLGTDRTCSKVALASEDYVIRLAALSKGAAQTRLNGHEAEISSLEFSLDGQKAITASHDATARIWDTKAGRATAILRGHEDRVLGARLSPNSKLAVTWSDDRTARLWDLGTGRQLWKIDGHFSPVASASFSPDSALIMTIGLDGQARLWSAGTGKPETFPTALHGGISSADFNQDGRHLITIARESTLTVWDTSTWTHSAELKGTSGEFRNFAQSADKKFIATVSWTGQVSLWSVESGVRIADLGAAAAGGVSSVRFSQDGHQLHATTVGGESVRWPVFVSSRVVAEHIATTFGGCLSETQREAMSLGKGSAPWCQAHGPLSSPN